ncbi:hypothetical protein QFC21_004899 [Naganishia friedmannii]|uniref:Uncharacterized protein n=1 Tax=Naganishia friedmannii TaxID=89922 RepID=A0ACC2VE60_9TREE|nr:hypothetical protein QFC21_004899 [Naganishia friedmannii]
MDSELSAATAPVARSVCERAPVEEHSRRRSSTPSLMNRVAPPQSEEEWVEFIDNYIRYGFVTQSDLFIPPDEHTRHSFNNGGSATTTSDLTPIQESIELPPMVSNYTITIGTNTEDDMSDPLPISPSTSAAPLNSLVARRPSPSKVDYDETSRRCRTMSTCSTGSMSGSGAYGESRRLEAQRVKQFYEQNGFLCAPAQLPRDAKKRLRAIRRLGFDGGDSASIRRATLDRYTRLLTSVLNAKMSTVTILGADSQLFPSEVGLGIQTLGTDLGICTHTALSDEKPLVVEDADKDWRFSNHPMVQSGVIKAYCGAPLRQGKSHAIIGTLCVIDDKPRPDFNADAQKIVKELAACVSNELELLAKADEQKLAQRMHDKSLKFSRQWLQSTASKTRTISRQKSNGRTRKRKKEVNITTPENGTEQDEDEQINLYDEACQYVAETIGASCTIIDTSSFHISYPEPAKQASPTPTSSERRQSLANYVLQSDMAEGGSSEGASEMVMSPVEEALEGGFPEVDVPFDNLQPQVYHLPKRSNSVLNADAKDANPRNAGILGSSEKNPALPENMSDILMSVIVRNLETRKIWYETGDGDGEGHGEEDPEEAYIQLLLGAHSAALEILMCAHDLRETLEIGLDESRTPTVAEKAEMFKICDIILAGAEKTQGILNAVLEYHVNINRSAEPPSFSQLRNTEESEEIEDIIAEALHDAIEQEKLKKAALGQDLSLVETVVEILPRKMGWRIARDGAAIKKILEYLLVNAFHATTEGYILITCEDISQYDRITNGYEECAIRLRIKDTGFGMEKEFYESGQIFEPFAKVDKFSSGAGLGATLAKSKLETLGGSIDYESQLGKGTLVTIGIPLRFQPEHQDMTNASSKVKLTRDRCVLLGFDNSTHFGIHVVGDFLKRKLERRDVEICNAEDADVIIIEERALNDENVQRLQQLAQIRQIDTIVLGSATSKRRWRSNPPFLDQECTIRVRWLFRPLNPSLIRQILQGPKGSSVTSEYDRRRSSTWTTHASRPSLTSSYSQMYQSEDSIGGDSTPQANIQSEDTLAIQVSTEEVVGPEKPSSVQEAVVNALESDLQILKQCLPASELKAYNAAKTINRQVLARMIKKLGHPYEEADDGLVGVEKYKTFRPSLVLMDIDMPYNGMAASADIRLYEAKHKITKAHIIAVTAITDDAAIARGKNECHMDDWLVKPLGLKLLREKIKELYETSK